MCGLQVASAVGDVREMDLKKADVWAVGVVLYTMLIGKFPWAHATFRSPEFVNYVRQGIDQVRYSHDQRMHFA
jgi:serine/threonine protein kinase